MWYLSVEAVVPDFVLLIVQAIQFQYLTHLYEKKRRKNIISGTSHYYHLGRVLGFCHNKIYLITPSSLIVSQFSVTPPLYALLAMTDSPSTALDNHVIPSKILCPRPPPLFPCKKYWLVPYLKSLSWTMVCNHQKWKCCMVLWF